MCTSSSGEFYVSTGPIGTTLGGLGGSGALVRINASQTLATGIASLGGALVNSQGVAISPNGNTLYVTVKDFNGAIYSIAESGLTPISVGGGGGGGGGGNGCSGGSQYPSTTLVPTPSWQTQGSIWAGEYSLFQVSIGKTYSFSLCSTCLLYTSPSPRDA